MPFALKEISHAARVSTHIHLEHISRSVHATLFMSQIAAVAPLGINICLV